MLQMFLNKRDNTVADWVSRKHPKILKYVVAYIKEATPQRKMMHLLINVGFEAGREFQLKNPKLALDDQKAYEFSLMELIAETKRFIGRRVSRRKHGGDAKK